MSDMNKRNLQSKDVPFFARYLEEQGYEDLSAEESAKIRGGGGVATRKYPSDNEDGGGGGVATRKYPSDNEDGGGGVATRKYPSDNEDGGGGGPATMKYPSDNEDGGVG